MLMTIKTVIVGLGKIGAINKSSKKAIRNHLNAILKNKNFEIKKLIDTDINQIEIIKKEYSFLQDDVFSNKYDSKKIQKIDLLVISSPPQQRSSQIQKLLNNFSTKILLIEKPLAENLKEAKKIINVLKKPNNSKIKVFINFIRRYSSGFNQIKDYIKEEKPLHINIRYNKGLINYGSHLIDFLIDWFGKIEYVESYDRRNYGENDMNISFYCKMKKKINVNFQFIDRVNYDQFEIDLFFKDKKISFRNGGVEKTKSEAIDSLYYSGYHHLGKKKIFKDQDLIGDLRILYEMICNYFIDKNYKVPLCDINQSFYNVKIIDSIISSFDQNKKIFIK